MELFIGLKKYMQQDKELIKHSMVLGFLLFKEYNIYDDLLIKYFIKIMNSDDSDENKFIRNFIDFLKNKELEERECLFRAKLMSSL